MNFMTEFIKRLTMNFPIYDISEFSWNNFRYKQHNILYENPYLASVPRNREKFTKRIREFKYVDPDGILYKVTGYKVHPNKGLAKLLFFLKKIEFEFVRIDEKYTIEMFKELLINRAKEDQDEKLEEIVKNANSFKDILYQI